MGNDVHVDECRYLVMCVMTHDIMKWDGLDHHYDMMGSGTLTPYT